MIDNEELEMRLVRWSSNPQIAAVSPSCCKDMSSAAARIRELEARIEQLDAMIDRAY